MSVFGKYIDAYDMGILLSLFIFGAVTAIFVSGELPASIETVIAAYGTAAAVCYGIIYQCSKLTKKPVCDKTECPERIPSLKEQGF